MARYDFCPQCGTANANGDFCINCGASLVTSDDVVDRDAPAPTVPIPVVPTPQGYLDENGRPVGVQPSGERGPQGDAPRRGVSKKTDCGGCGDCGCRCGGVWMVGVA